MTNCTNIVLASGSPRRRELLARAGFAFEVIVSEADETTPDGLSAEEAACHVAACKARAVAATQPADRFVIGADTMVVLDGVIFGKPADRADACRMLAELSGRTHEVMTGVCLICAGQQTAFCEKTLVTFKQLEPETIAEYVDTGEPMDKAGAYGIQGLGGRLVASIDGDYDNVVGLPVAALTKQLALFGIKPSA